MPLISNNDFDTTPAIHGTQIKSLEISINGLVLRNQDLVDVQINYEDVIKGRIAFVDTLNISEFAPLTYAFINIKIIDLMNNQVSIDTVVTNVEVLRLKNNQINISLNFEDINISRLKNTFISTSFKDTTVLKAIQSMFINLKINAYFYHDKNDYNFDYLVIPSNISLFEFIQKQIKISNIVMFSDRNGITFISKDLLDYSLLDSPIEHPFTLNRSNDLPHWNILEYNGNVNRSKYTQQVNNSNLHKIDINDIKYNPTKITIKELYSKQKNNGGMGMGSVEFPDLFSTTGIQELSHIEKNSIIGLDEDFRDIMNNNQRVEIAVQGLNVLRKYSKVQVDLPRAISVQTVEYDKTFGGIYVVIDVVDKIIGGNFYQFLTLNSSDYGKGKIK